MNMVYHLKQKEIQKNKKDLTNKSKVKSKKAEDKKKEKTKRIIKIIKEK